jgi:hypothetical protein
MSASADDNRPGTGDRNAAAFQDLDHAGRRARHQRRAILHQVADVRRVKAVDVLVGADDVEHAPFGVVAHGIRQRRLHEDAVVGFAPIELIDDAQQIAERGRRRQPEKLRQEASLAGGLQLVANVHFRGGILAHEHDAQPGRPSGLRRERRDGRRHFPANLVGYCRTVQYTRCHVISGFR